MFTYRPDGTSPEATLAELRGYDQHASALPADFTTFEVASDLIRAAERQRGPVELLVHAVGPIVVKSFAKSTPLEYREMVAGNLDSAVALAFAVLPGMRERGFGRLVYFGMNGSSVTRPARGMSLYGAAKAGVVTFARALALEEAQYGITINVIEPGDIRNKSVRRTAARAIAANNPTGHAGSWEDIADAVQFVIADEASFLNGMVLSVNGGLVESHE